MGQFRVWLPDSHREGLIIPPLPDLVIPNLVPLAGQEEFLKMLFRDDSAVAGGGDFYVGLCDQTPASSDTLSDVTSEPNSDGGYARKSIARNSTGWPTITTVNGRKVIRSKTVTWTASGADFSADIARLFLTDQASGTTGVLYAFSGNLNAALTIVDGQSFSAQYEFFIPA